MQKRIELNPKGKGFYEITGLIENALSNLPEQGLLNIFLHHTSAGLMINENADPTVLTDLENFTEELVPENIPYFVHTYEGPDDMPAHIKSSLFGCQINIPITNYKLNMGTWQGIFLCEFRNHPTTRKITITSLSS